MRVIICGPRNFNDYQEVKRAIAASNYTISLVISGCASGVDSLGERWARENEVEIKKFPALWDDFSPPCKIKTNKFGKKYNALAGFKRNSQMLEHADAVIAIQMNTPGTNDTIKKAKELGLDVYEYEPNRII